MINFRDLIFFFSATSAELETALKGLLFKEKDNNAKQEQEDIFTKLRAKGM